MRAQYTYHPSRIYSNETSETVFQMSQSSTDAMHQTELLLLVALLLLDCDDLLAIIHTAVLADAMGKAGFSATLADRCLNAFIAVCGMAHTDFALADFTLLNGHFTTPIRCDAC